MHFSTKNIIALIVIMVSTLQTFGIRLRPKFSATHNEATQIIYEVNIRQYTQEGTFNAFAKHLPRLQKMGIGTIWLMPIHPIGNINRKGKLGSYYSVKDYQAVNPEFGSMKDFKSLVSKAHKLGINVIIDWVANHSAWDNAWVTQHPEYYKKDSAGKMISPFDWTDVVQFDHNNDNQAKAMQDALEFWVKECNIDGYRCDVADMLPLQFWINARTRCEKIKPLIWLTESENNNFYNAFDIQYGWSFLHTIENWTKGKATIEQIDSVAQIYMKDYNREHYRMMFTTNHDENSWSGTEYERLGDKASDVANLMMNFPGVAMVYSGQEEPLKRRLQFFEKDVIKFKKYSLGKFYTKAISDRKKIYNIKSVLEDRATQIKINPKGTGFEVIISNDEHIIKTMEVK